jgi:hypothetical protein
VSITSLLKHDPNTKPELPFIDSLTAKILHAGDGHEVLPISDVVVRSGQMGRVREVERLQTELQPEAIVHGKLRQPRE